MANEILDSFQKEILSNFAKTELANKLYWSGGTCLAYKYLHHRKSEDLDFLGDDLFPDEWILAEVNKLKKLCKISRSSFQKKLNRWIFNFESKNQFLKFELVYYPFPAVGKRKINQEFGIKVDSLIDIAVNKVQTIFERQEPKDIFDLYWILKTKKMNLDELFKQVEKKFGSKIDPITWSAKAVDAAEKIEQLKPITMPKFMVGSYTLKDFFEKYSFKILKKKLK